LEFLYAHNTTHLLIDSTEIGKYTAFSSIGSDKNYDRFSWINTFMMDAKQTRETKNSTTHVYIGGSTVDEDILFMQDGKEIFLPRRNAILGAVVTTKNSNGEYSQPQGIFIYANKQYTLPLRYIHLETQNKTIDYKNGIEAGVFIYPSLDQNQNGGFVNDEGALLYLGQRTINSRIARLYLFGEESKYFKLIHSEENEIIKSFKNQGAKINNFIQYQGLQGPIKIWEIKYPSNIKFDEKYLSKIYPEEITIANEGEY
jgi:hypothetical protein